MMPTRDSLIRPVRIYIADYIKLLLLGAGPKHIACALTQVARDSREQAAKRFS